MWCYKENTNSQAHTFALNVWNGLVLFNRPYLQALFRCDLSTVNCVVRFEIIFSA